MISAGLFATADIFAVSLKVIVLFKVRVQAVKSNITKIHYFDCNLINFN